ncbi:MAG: serine hydrolase, partial [Bacteroidales bacterium]|nr:serine hydrolase [Bacteroidales bacterium]
MKLDKNLKIVLNFSYLLLFLLFLFTDCNSDNNSHKKFAKSFKTDQDSLETHWNNKYSDQIDKWFKNLCNTTRFNGNIIVAKDGEVIYQNYFGYSNYGRKDTLSLKSSFQIASVSKTFTSMAILILKERGLLQYNDDVKKYIPGFPYHGITIRQLLSHRSGMPNYNYFCDQYTDRETIIYNKDVVKLMVDSIPLPYYQPDIRFDYCNTNYVLLASIVENVSGKNFVDFMREEIFKKAGMKSTHIFINGKQDRIYQAATGYHFKWTVALPTYQDGVYGDKGVFTTVEDLWRWNLALENNILVAEKTLYEAFVPQSLEKKGDE